MKQKYIIIASTTDDLSTNDVMDYIFHIKPVGIEIMRFNDLIKINVEIAPENRIRFNFNDKLYINRNEILSYWYRRGKVTPLKVTYIIRNRHINMPNGATTWGCLVLTI